MSSPLALRDLQPSAVHALPSTNISTFGNVAPFERSHCSKVTTLSERDTGTAPEHENASARHSAAWTHNSVRTINVRAAENGCIAQRGRDIKAVTMPPGRHRTTQRATRSLADASLTAKPQTPQKNTPRKGMEGKSQALISSTTRTASNVRGRRQCSITQDSYSPRLQVITNTFAPHHVDRRVG